MQHLDAIYYQPVIVRVMNVVKEIAPNKWEVVVGAVGENIIEIVGKEPKKGAILEMEFLDRPVSAVMEIIDVLGKVDSRTWRVKVRIAVAQLVEIEGEKRPKEGELIKLYPPREVWNNLFRN
jgi:hypothetical protein